MGIDFCKTTLETLGVSVGVESGGGSGGGRASSKVFSFPADFFKGVSLLSLALTGLLAPIRSTTISHRIDLP